MFASLRLALAAQPTVAGKPIKLKNPNAGFFKAAVPFLAFCLAGSFFVSRFQSERLYMTDKQRNSMSMAEAKRREEEVEAELERIQKSVSTEWTQVPIPGSRDDPKGPAPPEAAIRSFKGSGK